MSHPYPRKYPIRTPMGIFEDSDSGRRLNSGIRKQIDFQPAFLLPVPSSPGGSHSQHRIYGVHDGVWGWGWWSSCSRAFDWSLCSAVTISVLFEMLE